VALQQGVLNSTEPRESMDELISIYQSTNAQLVNMNDLIDRMLNEVIMLPNDLYTCYEHKKLIAFFKKQTEVLLLEIKPERAKW
jgi:hypothetical protein